MGCGISRREGGRGGLTHVNHWLKGGGRRRGRDCRGKKKTVKRLSALVMCFVKGEREGKGGILGLSWPPHATTKARKRKNGESHTHTTQWIQQWDRESQNWGSRRERWKVGEEMAVWKSICSGLCQGIHNFGRWLV